MQIAILAAARFATFCVTNVYRLEKYIEVQSSNKFLAIFFAIYVEKYLLEISLGI